MRRLLYAFAIALSGLISALPASAGERAAAECSDPHILSKIRSRFDYQVKHVPHLPDVAIEGFSRVHQHRYYPVKTHHPIARRYCGARAQLSDGRSRYVWYLIENPMGYAGIGNNVEFCVTGFDRWHVYNGRCRVLQ